MGMVLPLTCMGNEIRECRATAMPAPRWLAMLVGLAQSFHLLSPSVAFAGDPSQVIDLFGRIIEQATIYEQRRQEREHELQTQKIERQNQIRELQHNLTILGYYDKTIDGLYGSGTDGAVRAFMAAFRIGGSVTLPQLVELTREKATYGWRTLTEEMDARKGGATPLVEAEEDAVSVARTDPETDVEAPATAGDNSFSDVFSSYMAIADVEADENVRIKRCELGAQLLVDYEHKLGKSFQRTIFEQVEKDKCLE